MDMPAELAQQLLRDGAILIVAGCPTGTEFGIDLSSYIVDDNFRGVKMIPAGCHYVYTASQGPYGDSALRVGFLHYFNAQEILIREWDADKEELRLRPPVTAEHERIRQNIKELDKYILPLPCIRQHLIMSMFSSVDSFRYLAPFDFESLGKWKSLSDDIGESKIVATMPECALVRTSAEFESCPDNERPKGNADSVATPNVTALRLYNNKLLQNDQALLPNLKVVAGTAIRFSDVPERCAANASPAQITSSFMDSIEAVDQLLVRLSTAYLLAEECQLSFVYFLVGCSVEALAHWRKMLNILANSEQAPRKYRPIYRRYLDVLRMQLPELPDEMMPATAYNTVYRDVQRLVANCTLAGLAQEAEYFSINVTQSMAWQFDDIFDEDPEDQPVIVEENV